MSSVYIIAEAGINHNGSLEMAMRLIDAAANAGADAVKFQSFKSDKLATLAAPKADYQINQTSSHESQQEMLKKYELDEEVHLKLFQYCREKQIDFLSSPFDLESLDLLSKKLKLNCIKIPSGEITNGPMLLKIAQLGKRAILSTGMSTLDDVKNALSVLAYGYLNPVQKPQSQDECCDVFLRDEARKILFDHVTLLHCTSEYPAPYEEVNLRAMDTLRNTFNLQVGFSDHTQGIAIPIAAVARGAEIIEKHFTLDKNLPGPDHQASIEPSELSSLVKSIRQVEKSLGDGQKIPSKGELKNKEIVRKFLVALVNIKLGEAFTEENLGIKRSGGGVSATEYWQMLGKKAQCDYKVDEKIKLL